MTLICSVQWPTVLTRWTQRTATKQKFAQLYSSLPQDAQRPLTSPLQMMRTTHTVTLIIYNDCIAPEFSIFYRTNSFDPCNRLIEYRSDWSVATRYRSRLKLGANWKRSRSTHYEGVSQYVLASRLLLRTRQTLKRFYINRHSTTTLWWIYHNHALTCERAIL